MALANLDTEGRLIYAVGDIHGRYDLLRALLEGIVHDARERGARDRPLLVFCGDYIDRGPQSALVLEALVWLASRPQFETRLIKGNHEHALLNFLDAPGEASAWLRFGGAETLASYGVSLSGDDDFLTAARDDLLARMPPSHLGLLRQLEMMVCVGDFAFVHAGVRPGVPLAEQAEHDLLWIREDFLEAPGPFEKVIVHGHTWTNGLQILDHRIGLDTGAYATGVLTAARIDETGIAVLDTARH